MADLTGLMLGRAHFFVLASDITLEDTTAAPLLAGGAVLFEQIAPVAAAFRETKTLS